MGEDLMVFFLFFKQLYIIVKNTLLIRFYSKAKNNFNLIELLNIICIIIVVTLVALILAFCVLISILLSGTVDMYFGLLLCVFVFLFGFFMHILCNFSLARFKFSSLNEEMNFCKNSEFNNHKVLFSLADDKNNGYVVMVIFGSNYSFVGNSESYVIPSAYTKHKNGMIGIAGVRVKFKTYKLIGNGDICNVRVGRIINKTTKDDLLIVASRGNVICTYNRRKLNLLYKYDGKYDTINITIYGIMENHKDKKDKYIYINSTKYKMEKGGSDKSKKFLYFAK